jgi:hypothetical protein
MDIPHIHNPYKTPMVLSTFTMKSNTTNSFTNDSKIPPVNNDQRIHKAALLPVLGVEPPLTQPSPTQCCYNVQGDTITPSFSSTTVHSTKDVGCTCTNKNDRMIKPPCKDTSVHSSREIIDLTIENAEESDVPPKKKSKTTAIDVTVIVTMPGLAHPVIKKMQSLVESESV